jgi:hypothetical protein
MIAGMCTQLWAERYPRECAGCGRPYARGLVDIGHRNEPYARTLTCRRGGYGPDGCGHVWSMPQDWQLVPVLRRCNNNRCPTWHEAVPSRPPFPAADPS